MPNHQRGNRPPDAPRSTCPNCGVYMQGVTKCWHCGYDRRDVRTQSLEEREDWESELMKADSWLVALSDEQLQAKIDKCLSKVEGFELETDERGRPERHSLARLIGRYVDIVLAETS